MIFRSGREGFKSPESPPSMREARNLVDGLTATYGLKKGGILPWDVSPWKIAPRCGAENVWVAGRNMAHKHPSSATLYPNPFLSFSARRLPSHDPTKSFCLHVIAVDWAECRCTTRQAESFFTAICPPELGPWIPHTQLCPESMLSQHVGPCRLVGSGGFPCRLPNRRRNKQSKAKAPSDPYPSRQSPRRHSNPNLKRPDQG